MHAPRSCKKCDNGCVARFVVAWCVLAGCGPDLATPRSTPVRVDELDTVMDDVGPCLSRDGTTIFWNYDAVTNGGNSEIYYATRTCLARRR
jgi:hypothetical protein